MSGDGQRIASGGLDMAVNVWDADTGACMHTLTWYSRWVTCRCVCFSLDGKLLASSSDDNTVMVWALHEGEATPTVLHTMRGHTDYVTGVAFSPDGTCMAHAGWQVPLVTGL
jgi:WD40 repeat protein